MRLRFSISRAGPTGPKIRDFFSLFPPLEIKARLSKVAIFAKIPKGCAREPVVKFRHGPTPPL